MVYGGRQDDARLAEGRCYDGMTSIDLRSTVNACHLDCQAQEEDECEKTGSRSKNCGRWIRSEWEHEQKHEHEHEHGARAARGFER